MGHRLRVDEQQGGQSLDTGLGSLQVRFVLEPHLQIAMVWSAFLCSLNQESELDRATNL
jgi:hypothetical protein